jgi:hypothetical protein
VFELAGIQFVALTKFVCLFVRSFVRSLNPSRRKLNKHFVCVAVGIYAKSRKNCLGEHVRAYPHTKDMEVS